MRNEVNVCRDLARGRVFVVAMVVTAQIEWEKVMQVVTRVAGVVIATLIGLAFVFWLFGWGAFDRSNNGPVAHGRLDTETYRGPSSSRGVAARSNPQKEEFLGDCAEFGAPVTSLRRGILNCKSPARRETYIDGERVE